ncbi:MAG: NUDIX domain-containing protein [Rhizobium sp.]
MKRSAGLMIYRLADTGEPEVLLVHPGGPFWARRDVGAWSIPKGGVEPGEDDLAAARREVREEIGADIDGPFTWLGEFRQPGGKLVIAWAVAANVDVSAVVSNDFEMEWPPKSGVMQRFPEVDRAAWLDLQEAAIKILVGQKPVLQALETLLLEQGKD